ncbi:nitrile hydratase subunit beta [Pleurocapsales cyanobacterium LEGE 06147]|nr:nitrile hydratase subunit beta [Pleurocapsales cyanobacterium LEGE 06147]
MKLQHYLGGLEGLDSEPLNFEKQIFVEPWETRIFGIHVAMMGLSQHLSDTPLQYPLKSIPTTFKSTWTWADLRKGAEAMNPFDYFRFRYYEKWLGGISGFFMQEGYITEEQLDARTAVYLEKPDAPLPSVSEPTIDEQIVDYLRRGDPAIREVDYQPKFSVGQKIEVKDVLSTDHTRLPGYLRNRTGSIEKVYEGAYAYLCSTGPDGLGEPMYVYSVKFDPKNIWGDMAEGNSWVYADLFEVYVEAAK